MVGFLASGSHWAILNPDYMFSSDHGLTVSSANDTRIHFSFFERSLKGNNNILTNSFTIRK